MILGGSNYRGQLSTVMGSNEKVKLFCCTGWGTVILTETNTFKLSGFDINDYNIEELNIFCKNNEPIFMSGGAHHIAIGSKDKVLIISNRTKRTINFCTESPIKNVYSSAYDTFVIT